MDTIRGITKRGRGYIRVHGRIYATNADNTYTSVDAYAGKFYSSRDKLSASMMSFAWNLYNAFLSKGTIIDMPLSSCVVYVDTSSRCRFCGRMRSAFVIESLTVSAKRDRVFGFNMCGGCLPYNFHHWITPRDVGEGAENADTKRADTEPVSRAPFTREFISARRRALVRSCMLQEIISESGGVPSGTLVGIMADQVVPNVCYICAKIPGIIRFWLISHNRTERWICDICARESYIDDGARVVIVLTRCVTADIRGYIICKYIRLMNLSFIHQLTQTTKVLALDARYSPTRRNIEHIQITPS